MVKRIRPHRLAPGDVIGIVAPAGPPSEAHLSLGIRYLEERGYHVEIGSHVLDRHGYLAGTDSERVADLHAMFRNPKIKAVVCARGGYGSQRILTALDFGLIAKNPKILMGYSDITSLLVAVHRRTGLVVFHGPMAATDMGRGWFDQPGEESWDLLTGRIPSAYRSSASIRIGPTANAAGRLIGGCLSLLNVLPGTPFAPHLRQHLLFIEDIGEDPYKLDRMLTHLRLAGWFNQLAGLLVGSMARCVPADSEPSLTISEILSDVVADYGIPVAGDFSFGHDSANPIMPIGIRAELNPREGTLRLLEQATE